MARRCIPPAPASVRSPSLNPVMTENAHILFPDLTGALPFEDGDLLPQGENFQGSVVSTTDESSKGGQESKYELEH